MRKSSEKEKCKEREEREEREKSYMPCIMKEYIYIEEYIYIYII